MNVKPDFETDGQIRYTHRAAADWDMYFIANRTGENIKANTVFRSVKGAPQLWDPVTGGIRQLPEYKVTGTQTTINIQFDAYQSFFVVFSKESSAQSSNTKNFSVSKTISTLNGPWQVNFDPKWGGPANITFNQLQDWTTRPEEGIKYYSGTAVYKKVFDLPAPGKQGRICLDLGEINNLARIKLNGKDLGVVWTAPWRVDVTAAVLKKGNKLEIEVVNLWPNRLIGDSKFPDDGIKDETWPEWLVKRQPRNSKRLTFATYNFYDEKSPLLKSGLVGPVTIQFSER